MLFSISKLDSKKTLLILKSSIISGKLDTSPSCFNNLNVTLNTKILMKSENTLSIFNLFKGASMHESNPTSFVLSCTYLLTMAEYPKMKGLFMYCSIWNLQFAYSVFNIFNSFSSISYKFQFASQDSIKSCFCLRTSYTKS